MILESATARGRSSSLESMAPVSKKITLWGALIFFAAMAARMEMPVPQKTISLFLISLAAIMVIISFNVYSMDISPFIYLRSSFFA